MIRPNHLTEVFHYNQYTDKDAIFAFKMEGIRTICTKQSTGNAVKTSMFEMFAQNAFLKDLFGNLV